MRGIGDQRKVGMKGGDEDKGGSCRVNAVRSFELLMGHCSAGGVSDMTSGSEEGKYWGLGVWVGGRIGQKDAPDCRDLWLRRDCDYQWAILVPTHPHFSLRHLEAGLRNERHPGPLPCLSALPLPLA